MKKKLFFVLAALMMLTGTSAMAQSETLKGDVNGDGAVDVADIAAVIQIMKDNGDIETKYYWYVGPNNPAEMTSISPIVGEDVSNGVGFRILDMNKTYSATNKLYDGLRNPIVGEKSTTWYIMLPKESGLKFYDDLGESPLEIITTKDFGDGVIYNIYCDPTSRPTATYGGYIYH